MKNQGNMPSPKEYSNSPITEHKGTKFCDLADKKIQSSCFEETQQATRKVRKNLTKSQKIHDKNKIFKKR